MNVIDKRRNWKDAFNCKKCLKKERPDCPCYIEYTEVNTQTQETRIVKTCIFQMLPQLLIKNTRSADGVHTALTSFRNVMAKKLENALKLKALEIKQLEKKNGNI